VGGLVTSNDAGLAVVDWPNSFGYNMFLYPLSRMTGGIYYEHAHRLFGSLVGLTTLVITIHLFRTESRKGIKILTGCILVAVIFQGILGGLRVTGRFTLSTSQADVAPSLTLAVVHGVVGQIFLGMLTALAVFTSTAWLKGKPWNDHQRPMNQKRRLDLWLSGSMVLLVIIQVFFGALQRHFATALSYHIGVASVIAMIAVFMAARANGFDTSQWCIRRFGMAMAMITGLQIVLGFAALLATMLHTAGEPFTVVETLLPTAHQAAGAVLLAVTVGMHLWMWRETVDDVAS
jgi:heme a synthase